ncbi:trehalose-6-phosphate synthase, partial [Streptomyces olivaceoviridis]
PGEHRRGVPVRLAHVQQQLGHRRNDAGAGAGCKEYVACRYREDGALVLSEFAGAAAELTGAFLVNPHHLDEVENALAEALAQSPQQARLRMGGLRSQVLTHDVEFWARSFLAALSDGRPGVPGSPVADGSAPLASDTEWALT